MPETDLSDAYLAEFESRILDIQTRVHAACHHSERDPKSVQLLAVSKRQPVRSILAAYRCGLRSFGENYAEEAAEKMEQLANLPDIMWEMVGHIQSRKARLVVAGYQRIHSLDSLKLAQLLNQLREGEPQEVLLEVNVSGEESKGGFAAVTEADQNALLSVIQKMAGLDHLRITGLMAMPPLQHDPEQNRVYFRRLSDLAVWLNAQQDACTFDQLSMGTSSDFEVAIEEGATIIRLGESIFGPRIYEEKI